MKRCKSTGASEDSDCIPKVISVCREENHLSRRKVGVGRLTLGRAVLSRCRHSETCRNSAGRMKVLFYNLSGSKKQAFSNLVAAFKELRGCSGRWHVAARERCYDARYHAGADAIVQCEPADFNIGGLGRICNIEVPLIETGIKTFYFCPDRLLVVGKEAVVAPVFYSSLRLDARREEVFACEVVPPDAQVVGHTWRFVNKDGTPDRRFNNRRIPILLYEELSMRTDSGINELFHLSRAGAAAGFIRAVDGLAALGARRQG
jgi:hypothetical protein